MILFGVVFSAALTKADESVAFTVLGLTDPIRSIVGRYGLHMRTGLIRLISSNIRGLPN